MDEWNLLIKERNLEIREFLIILKVVNFCLL